METAKQTRIVFATSNVGKMREIREILEDTGIPVLSLKDAGITICAREDGTSFAENALIKARAAARALQEAASACAGACDTRQDSSAMPCTIPPTILMADDSGLEIDYLGGEPGIYSARYLGEHTSYTIKNQNLIDRLKGVPDAQRTARFVCAIAAICPDGTELVTKGSIEGKIGYEARGNGGFGYDPIFYVPEFGKTTAELTEEEKNSVSHRGKALQLMKEELRRHENIDCK